MSQTIHNGQPVIWNPSADLHQMFSPATAFRLYHQVPVRGIVKGISGNAGMLAFLGPQGKEEIPVLLSECEPAGVR
jgi:uncharacterized membrane protein